MKPIKVLSFAKINLDLKILGIRPDGFHELESIMQTVSLHDVLTFSETPINIELSCNTPGIPLDEKNICFKAAKLLKREINIDKGISIQLEKNIPSEAGLGGGSSNGAATLVALNKIWDLGLSHDELIKYAAQLGSDVVFFIDGGRAMCRGRGERIEQRTMSKEQRGEGVYIIVKPDVSVSTKWAYKEYDNVAAQNIAPVITSHNNDLEPVVIREYPIIAQIKQDLLDAGCSFAQMTGSGSAVFGVIADPEAQQKAVSKLKNRYYQVFVSGPTAFGSKFI